MDANWTQKGATLSDKSARKEFGLTQQEIIAAIRAGKLQYRQNYAHGNPFLRLLRNEVEVLVAVHDMPRVLTSYRDKILVNEDVIISAKRFAHAE